MTPQNSSNARPEFSPLSIARMLWKQKIPLTLLWILLTGLTVMFVGALPTIYKAEAMILVESQGIPSTYISSTVNNGDLTDRLATITQQILSTSRLKKVIADFDLYHEQRQHMHEEDIILKMRKDIEVTPEKGWTDNKPGAFRVSYMGTDPIVVAEVANRLANLFIEENLRTREYQAEGTSQFIQSQLQEAKKRLDALEAAVTQYKIEHNGELPEQGAALEGTLSRLQTELQGTQDAISRAQQSRIMTSDSLSMAESTEAALRQAAQSAQTRAAALGVPVLGPTAPGAPAPDSLEALEAKLQLMRMRYSDEYPDVKRLREQIARVKATGAAAQSSTQASAPASGKRASASAPAPNPIDANPDLLRAHERTESLKTQLTLIDRDIAARNSEQQRILGQIAQYQRRLESLPVREQQMANLTRDYEIAKGNYKSLLDKKLAAEMSTDMERRQKSERFTLLDPAAIPDKPFKPNRPLFNGLGVAFSLLLAMAVAAGREMKSNVLLGEWELPKNVPVLGRVPNVKLDSAGRGLEGGRRLRRRRLAVVSSALIGILVIGFLLVSHRL